MQPVTQISKIQIRRGNEGDLPGAPISTSPLVFGEGLDLGEPAIALNTGRMFIGMTPTVGQPNYERITYPYRNVEILTENSTELLNTIVQSNIRETNEKSFLKAILTDSNAWTDVSVTRPDGPMILKLEGETLAATIEYYLFDEDNIPLKHGTLRVLHSGGSADVYLTDDNVDPRRLDITSDAAMTPAVFSTLDFRVVVAGIPDEPHYRLQTQNALGVPMTVLLRITRPIP